MEFLHRLFDLILHLSPEKLAGFCDYCGVWVYLVLFCIIFAETGFVVTPFLPGDSLLFTAGVIVGSGALHPVAVFVLLAAAAIGGDTVNYWIGKFLGPKVLRRENSRFLKKEYLDRTHAYFEKYGGKTIIIARFVPIVRTFAPFVAGVGAMSYIPFLCYNVIGGVAWVALCMAAGYYFGGLDFVRRHFELVVVMIVMISIMPGVIEYLKHRRAARRNSAAGPAQLESAEDPADSSASIR